MTQYRVWIKALWNGREKCVICSIDQLNAYANSRIWEVMGYELVRIEEYL